MRRQRFVRFVYSGRADDGPDAQGEPVEAPPPGAGKQTGLLVDDTDMVRAGSTIMLKDRDYTVDEVGFAADALCLAGGGLHVDAR